MAATLCKTAAARAELASDQRRLSQRHRTLLLLIDGQRSLEQIESLASQAGVPRGYIDELLALGMVVMAAPSDLRFLPVPPAPAAVPQTLPMPFPDAQDTVGLGAAMSNTDVAALDHQDPVLAQSKASLLEVLRTAAPWSSAVTQLRVRRVRQRQELLALLPEIQTRLRRLDGGDAADRLIDRVHQLLSGRA